MRAGGPDFTPEIALAAVKTLASFAGARVERTRTPEESDTRLVGSYFFTQGFTAAPARRLPLATRARRRRATRHVSAYVKVFFVMMP
jgi:hypothetical protein